MAQDPAPHISKERARGGSRVGMTRVILPVSLVLVIIVFAVVYFAA